MRSFLVKGKKPIVKWGSIPKGIMYKGAIPEGYGLAISPDDNYIIIDVDRHGDKDGFDNIPGFILEELSKTLFYPTKNNGAHYWLEYTGDKILPNKTSNLGIDLRTNKGYVVWYPDYKLEDCLDKISKSSDNLNKWIEEIFNYVKE